MSPKPNTTVVNYFWSPFTIRNFKIVDIPLSMEGPLVQHFANALSTATILSCLFLKVPQIMHIREKKSAEGIYLQAMLMEIVSFSIVTMYNFTNDYSLLTYLEYPIILLQIYVLLYYTFKFKKLLSSPVIPLGTMIYFTLVAAFGLAILPKEPLSYLVPFCTPLSGFAKVTYIYGIIKAENADAVSLTTWIISISTNVARLFTVYVDSADTKLMMNFVISALLSTGVLLTAMYYQRLPVKPQRGRKSVKQHDHEHENDKYYHERAKHHHEHDDNHYHQHDD